MALKARILDDVKTAMRAGERDRLAVLRLITAAIKQQEVDQREELDDAAVLAVLDKSAKQRRESIEQFEQAGREDLAEKERFELAIIQTYLPEPLSQEELTELIDQAIAEVNATGMQDMGRVMGQLQPQLRGRADMRAVSAQVRDRLSGANA